MQQLSKMRISKMLFGASVLLLAASLWYAGQNRTAHAASRPSVPRTIHLVEESVGPHGDRLTIELTAATRSDGSRSQTRMTRTTSGGIGEHQRYLDFADRLRIASDFGAGVKTSFRRSESGFRSLMNGRLDPASKCTKTIDGTEVSAFKGGVALLGEDIYQGFQVMKTKAKDPNIEIWYAPDLGCEIVYQVVQYAAEGGFGTSTRRMTKADLGIPDEALFQLPADFEEMAPSAFAVRLGERCNRTVKVESYAEEDQIYWRQRP